jgi:hypothetical protein
LFSLYRTEKVIALLLLLFLLPPRRWGEESGINKTTFCIDNIVAAVSMATFFVFATGNFGGKAKTKS